MFKKTILSVLTSALLVSSGVALAADVAVQDQTKTQQTTGRQLMTPEEQNGQRTKMRNATSAEERKEIRNEHHEKMKEKAREKGATIPDNPPARGQGGGMGAGQGGGMRGGR
ncbi:MAG: hypothetical protein PHI11_03730 [Gallionella sp.]|jgi:Ni/Co efflux regulator RcnB|nr:hypothetical protein [Gallionella sp.]